MGYCSIGCLMDERCGRLWSGRSFFLCLQHHHHTSPSPSRYLLVFLLSLFLTISFCLWLRQPLLWPTAMSVSNFFSLVLFILSFSPPSILPDPHCLFRLPLFSSLCIFTGSLLLYPTPPPHTLIPSEPTPSPLHPNCSFLWTLQLCCSHLQEM